jgi:hypothetical protein
LAALIVGADGAAYADGEAGDVLGDALGGTFEAGEAGPFQLGIVELPAAGPLTCRLGCAELVFQAGISDSGTERFDLFE